MPSATLNFNTGNRITGVNVIDGQLIWTDDRNEPRSIDIEAFKAANHGSGTTRIYNRNFLDRDITVIRPHPFAAPIVVPTSAAGLTDRPFRDIFPKFSYRWRYNDGKYSPFAPFTEAVFAADGTPNVAFPSDIFSSYSDSDSFEQGLNSNMHNSVTSLILRNVPTGGPDVESVDILYTESISSTIYVIRTINVSTNDRNLGVLGDVVITRRTLTGALPANQLIRPFDNVPRLAKSQEITANRLIYGNYLQNYNQPSSISMAPSIVPRSTSSISGLSVKTNRRYEVGVVFIDEFGRQGGLITSDSGSVESPFFASDRLRFNVQINAAATPAPDWATHFRYYIKDTSNEHFNLTSSNSYFNTEEAVNPMDTSGIDVDNIWLGFNSKDRNKITEDTVLVPRRHTQGTTLGVLFEGPSLHPVLEISNEAPEILLIQAEASAGATDDATRLAARQAFQADAQGQFFVRVKIATDPNSGGGHFLSTGQSTVAVSAGSASAEVSRWRVTILRPTGTAFESTVVNYTNAAGNTASVTLFPGTSHIEAIGRPTNDPSNTVDAFIIEESDSSSDPVVARTEMLNQTFFETMPIGESALDLYWETSDTFFISGAAEGLNYGDTNVLSWSNCYAFSNPDFTTPGIFLESVRIGDEFNSVSIDKGVRVNTPQENYQEDRRGNGLIFSGILNDRTGINRLNEFVSAEGITQELDPNYGTIQKLHTRNNYLISLCESKIFRTLADKDLLFNADGSGNIASTNQVLGDTSPVIGEYGISQHPESFASYGNNIYFTDVNRGAVMQYTPNNGQLFEISQRGMSDFFRDRFAAALPNFKAIGSFNDYKNSYIISLQNYDHNDPVIGDAGSFADVGSQTIAYDLDTQRWPSRYSFIPESGISLNNRYYTWSNGRAWLHNVATRARNNFYGTQSQTDWETVVNAQTPSVVKNWVSIGYEGDDDWELVEFSTNEGTTDILGFVEKEGKFYASISGTESVYEIVGASGSVTEMTGDITDNGFVLRPTTETRRTSGIKGLFATVRLRNTETTEREIHAINSTYFDSSF